MRCARPRMTPTDDYVKMPPASERRRRSVNDELHLALGVVQTPAAVGGDDNDVLDPHAEAAREVGPGLDLEARPGPQRKCLTFGQVGRLVGG